MNGARRTSLAQQHYQRQTSTSNHNNSSTANMTVYYTLPAIGKVGSHYVRQIRGQQTLSLRA
jgi:hypothetical protein